MKQEPQTPPAGVPPPLGGPKRRTANPFLPPRESLHPYVRLTIAAAANILLAVWVLPQVGHIRDPDYSLQNALWTIAEIAIPCATLLVLAPVFILGRDIQRLIAIGLSFFPAYIAVAGIGSAFSI
jgi:hypothetical protein